MANAAGTMSRRVNVKTLKNYEFALPPLDQQLRIAEIFWGLDGCRVKTDNLLNQSRSLRKILLLSIFDKIGRSYSGEKIRDLGEIQLGRQRAPKYTTGMYTKPYLRVINVLDGKLHLGDIEEMDFNDHDFTRYKLQYGDVLITEGDITSPYNVGRSAVYRGEIDNCCYQNTLIRFRAGNSLIPEYAQAALQNAFYRGVFAGVAGTTTVSHLGSQRFGEVRIPVLPLEEQKQVCEKLLMMDQSIEHLNTHYAALTTLQNILLEALIGGELR